MPMSVSRFVFSLIPYTVYMMFETDVKLCPSCPSCFLTVVQRVDIVSEGIANYGGKIIAVESDLKKLGKVHISKLSKSYSERMKHL